MIGGNKQKVRIYKLIVVEVEMDSVLIAKDPSERNTIVCTAEIKTSEPIITQYDLSPEAGRQALIVDGFED